MSIAAKKKLESEIKDLKEALDSEFTPNNFKDDIRKEIAKSKAELEKLIKAEKDEKAATPQKKLVATKKQTQVKKEEKKSALQKVRERKQKMASVKKPTAKKSTPTKVPASSVKDASRKALKPGWRVSKEGNRYYEGRANRSDSQRRKYPYLEDGGFVNEGAGMFAKGGKTKLKNEKLEGQIKINYHWTCNQGIEIPEKHKEALKEDALDRIFEMIKYGYYQGELNTTVRYGKDSVPEEDINEGLSYSGWFYIKTQE